MNKSSAIRLANPHAPPVVTACPNCGTHVHPDEKVVGGITYFNCRRCDFSTWNWEEYLAPERPPATDEEIERSFDAYR